MQFIFLHCLEIVEKEEAEYWYAAQVSANDA
jgi:hypothetical protein